MTTKTSKEIKLSLREKLSNIQVEFKANKSRYNAFGKYNFRSAEDILEGLKPFNVKYGVYFTITESIGDINSLPIITTTASIFNADGDDCDYIEATAIVGVDLAQKGMQIPQAFGSASSYCKKYALGNLLLIDDTQDSDSTNTHGKEEVKKPTSNPTPTKKQVLTDLSKVKVALSNDRDSTIKLLNDKYDITPAQRKELGI
jgi:hypothetical protein